MWTTKTQRKVILKRESHFIAFTLSSLASGHMYFCFLGTSQYAILRAVPNRPSFRPSRPSKTMLPRRFRDAKVFRHLQLEDLEGAKKFSSAAIPTGRRLWVEIQ